MHTHISEKVQFPLQWRREQSREECSRWYMDWCRKHFTLPWNWLCNTASIDCPTSCVFNGAFKCGSRQSIIYKNCYVLYKEYRDFEAFCMQHSDALSTWSLDSWVKCIKSNSVSMIQLHESYATPLATTSMTHLTNITIRNNMLNNPKAEPGWEDRRQGSIYWGGVGGKLLPQTLQLPPQKFSHMHFKIMALR